LGEASKAAALLAAAQARKAHLENVTLRAAYLDLGRDIYAAGRFRDEFAELYAEIGEAERRIEQIASSRPQGEPSKGLAERATKAAAVVKATAQGKALSLKKDSYLKRLGESAYARLGKAAGPAHLVGPIVEVRGSIECLAGDIRRLQEAGRGKWVTPQRLLVASGVLAVAVLILAAPKLSHTGAGDSRTHADGGGGRKPASGTLDATAAFFRAYPESAMSGEFRGKVLIVTGSPVSFVELGGGVKQLHLTTTFRGVSALCKFSTRDAAVASSLDAGRYTVEGTFSGSPRDGFVELTDCRLVDGDSSRAPAGDAPLPSIEQFLKMVGRSGEVTNPRKGLPILVASKYELRAVLGEPTNVISSRRDRKGTHEILDYACEDGRVLLSVTYDMAGAWIKEVAPRRAR
jgi:hypothetical protein